MSDHRINRRKRQRAVAVSAAVMLGVITGMTSVAAQASTDSVDVSVTVEECVVTISATGADMNLDLPLADILEGDYIFGDDMMFVDVEWTVGNEMRSCPGNLQAGRTDFALTGGGEGSSVEGAMTLTSMTPTSYAVPSAGASTQVAANSDTQPSSFNIQVVLPGNTPPGLYTSELTFTVVTGG